MCSNIDSRQFLKQIKNKYAQIGEILGTTRDGQNLPVLITSQRLLRVATENSSFFGVVLTFCSQGVCSNTPINLVPYFQKRNNFGTRGQLSF